MSLTTSKLRLLFYSLWLILSLLQAGLTNLMYDEAYYWFTSTELRWGYFYHPPLTDLLIRLGFTIFSNELGVRLLFVISTTAGIFLMEKLLLRNDKKLYYALMISIVPFQVLGFLAAPDIPLFFLAVTFYLLFRRFLEKDELLFAILLAVNSALLLYAKYHGILLIGFTFLWNIRILLKRRNTLAWVAGSVILFLPHILWQVRNDFPTLMFHLFERPGHGIFDWQNLLDYIPGQLLIAGPLAGFIIFWSLFLFKPKSQFEQTMLFNLIAMYSFFFIISFYHHIEANWTVIGLPALVVLSHKAMTEHVRLGLWIYRLLPLSLMVALVFRLLLIFPQWLPGTRLEQEFYGYEDWAKSISEVAGDRPVVFDERYQRPSTFAFYADAPLTYTLNPNRKSDFDLFGLEEQLQGKTVLFVSRRRMSGQMNMTETTKGTWYFQEVPDFRSYKSVRLEPEPLPDQNDQIIRIKMNNEAGAQPDFAKNPSLTTYVGYILYSGNRKITQVWRAAPAIHLTKKGYAELKLPTLMSGKYTLQFTLKTGWLTGYRSSRVYSFIIK